MKSTIFFLLAICVYASGCSKNGSSDTTTNNNPDPSQTVMNGTWFITSYSQRNEDKTPLFRDYIFTFSTGSLLKITNNAAVINGTWSYIPAYVGYYGSGGTNAIFNLNAGSDDPLIRLNGTWNINSINTSNISLINPEPADNEVLIFTKQ